ncbi:hypothetical protein [Bacillus smithii]|uniref:hypothetical protein n=1 Tax=Bacillus smithii TaxID=1479 RepID=UPI003D18FE34
MKQVDKNDLNEKVKVTIEFDADDEVNIERFLVDSPIRIGVGNKKFVPIKDHDWVITLPHNQRVNGKIEYIKEGETYAIREFYNFLLKVKEDQ